LWFLWLAVQRRGQCLSRSCTRGGTSSEQHHQPLSGPQTHQPGKGQGNERGTEFKAKHSKGQCWCVCMCVCVVVVVVVVGGGGILPMLGRSQE
jgi:hypothetical protein